MEERVTRLIEAAKRALPIVEAMENSDEGFMSDLGTTRQLREALEALDQKPCWKRFCEAVQESKIQPPSFRDCEG